MNADSGTFRVHVDRNMRKAATFTDHTDTSALKTILTEAGNLLALLSLAPFPSFQGKLWSSPTNIPPEIYSIFWFEPLHNLYLGVSLFLKSFLMIKWAHPTWFSHRSGQNTEQNGFKSLRTKLLSACYALLDAIEKNHSALVLHVNVEKK